VQGKHRASFHHSCHGWADAGDQPGLAARGSQRSISIFIIPKSKSFLEIRKAWVIFNRKGLNLHHGINVTDRFHGRGT